MNYDIISTGSKGNCTIMDKIIAIDMGISFKQLKPYYKNLKLVLLTHIHSDHFNKKTIKKLAQERPMIRIAACEWLIDDLVKCGVNKSNIDVLEINKIYNYRAFKVSPVELYHDVPNCGYRLFINGKKAIYATDTNKLDHIEAKDYDLYLVEGNYEELEINDIIKEKENNNEYVYEYRVLNTHMSKEKTTEWLLKNMNENSIYNFMHEHIEKET